MKRYLDMTGGSLMMTTVIAICLIGQGAIAADVYVMKADGTNAEVSHEQLQQITDSVKQAVRTSPENYLVQAESEADFIIEPFIVNQGNGQLALRIEKVKDGEVMAVSQDTFNWKAKDQLDAVVSELTNRAVSVNSYVAGTRPSYPANSPNLSARTHSNESTSGASSPYDNSANATPPTTSSSAGTAVADNTMGSGTAAGGAIIGSSPNIERNKFGYYGLGLGPSFSSGLANDHAMYDVIASYNHSFNDIVTGKIIGDFNIGSDTDTARFIDLGVGADAFLTALSYGAGRPYITGDVGYAFARDNFGNTNDNIAVGAGAGFKFLASQLNYDINLHYQVLTGKIAGTNPSLLGLRAAVNF